MNQLPLDFHHLGLAVKAPEQATRFLEGLGYVGDSPIFDPLQRVNLRMFRAAPMPSVELIWPGTEPSPIDNIVLKHGSAIYHACYTTRDVPEALRQIRASGLKVLELSPPTPAVLFGGQRVSFYSVTGFGIIEIIDVASS